MDVNVRLNPTELLFVVDVTRKTLVPYVCPTLVFEHVLATLCSVLSSLCNFSINLLMTDAFSIILVYSL